ncbi:MAG: flagellar motor switch protein FliN [Opitutales bacterium]
MEVDVQGETAMSEIDLDKDLQDMLKDAGSEGGASGEKEGASLAGLAEDLGSLAEPAPAEEKPAESGDSFALDDEMTSLMQEPSSGGGTGHKGVMPASAFAPVGAGGHGGAVTIGDTQNLEFLLDIKLNVTFEVGRAKMLISDLLTLGQGSVIELHRLVGDELDLLVNGRLIAKGEVVVINEKFGCRITNIISPEDRVKHMGGM